MNNSILVGVGALILGGVGGFVAGSSGGNAESTEVVESKVPSKGVRGGGSASSGGSFRATKAGSFSDIMKESGQTARMQSLLDLYASLDPSEFAAEAAKLDELPWNERMVAGFLLFSRWAEVDPQAALAYTSEMGREGFMVKGTVLQSWASTDPQAAAKYFEENPRDFGMMGGFGGRGGGAASQIAMEWAKQDPAGALEWAQGLEGRNASSAIGGVFRQVAQDDPAGAAALAAGLGDDERAGAYQSIAREWAQQDWGATEAWINGLPSDERDGAMAQAIRGLASEDPALASTKVSSLPDGEAKSDAIRSISERWAREDAASAAEWLVSQETDNVGRSMREVMGNWVGQDQAAALAFVNSQPEGAMRDSAAASYIMSNRGGDTQEALQMAETISDEGSRQMAIGVTAMRWMQDDKEAALEYVNTTESLSDEAKQRIIRRSEGGDRGGFGRGRGGPGGGRGGR